MLAVFSYIFVANTKIIFGYNFLAPLKEHVDIFSDTLIGYFVYFSIVIG